MIREESIILSLWIEFSHEEDDDGPFRNMGKFWHGYVGALQGAEKYLKEKKLINNEGVPIMFLPTTEQVINANSS